MARRKRKSRSRKRATRCKVVNVCGTRRRLCWGKNGRIVSNKRA